ncbi:hypothetical protein AMECASPLE_020288 [Ameca splendens]|uniref:Uncharacterized protein n=1 Tax=Ameca splendens TaxID=208324 RepID=A0ABV0YQ54_9TELE
MERDGKAGLGCVVRADRAEQLQGRAAGRSSSRLQESTCKTPRGLKRKSCNSGMKMERKTSSKTPNSCRFITKIKISTPGEEDLSCRKFSGDDLIACFFLEEKIFQNFSELKGTISNEQNPLKSRC